MRLKDGGPKRNILGQCSRELLNALGNSGEIKRVGLIERRLSRN
jgi:hypothetical protein